MAINVFLKKKPKGVTIIEGFPGIGLIGTITTEFLVEHLKTEHIGSVIIDDTPATVAIHNGQVVEPISIHYSKTYNLVIIHAISIGKGVGWRLADVVIDVAKQLQATEIVSVEGVGSAQPAKNTAIYYYASNKTKATKLDKFAKPLDEGIIVGVTGALLVRAKQEKVALSALFAETQSNLPDSKAAAAIVKALDQYLGLKVDPKPLLKQAKMSEDTLKTIAKQSGKTAAIRDKKELSYVG